VSWPSHEAVVFGTSFSDARLGPLWSVRDRIFGDDLEQLIEEATLFSWLGMRGIECVSPLAEGIDGSLEAKTGDVDIIECGRLLHESADQVIGDDMQCDFLANHLGSAAAKHVHAEGDLDVAKEQLDTPAAEIKLGQLFGRICDGIGQCGDDDNGLRPKAGDIDLNVKHSQSKRLGNCLPFAFGNMLWASDRLGPGDEAILGAEALAFSEVGGPGFMDAHNRINTLELQLGDGQVGTEATIGERDVAFVKEPVLLAEEATFVDMLITLCQIQECPAGKAEATDQFRGGEPAAVGLIAALRPYRLVFGGVGHGYAGAVDDFDMSAQPQLFGPDPAL